MSEGNFRDNERWLLRARATPSRFYGWNHSTNAAPNITIRLNMLANPLSKYSIHLDILTSAASDHSIRLETLAAPLFKHPIRFGVPAMDEKLPQRGYTFDSPGLPTIGGYPG